MEYSRAPVTRTLKGNEKQFELAGVWVIGVDRKIQFANSAYGSVQIYLFQIKRDMFVLLLVFNFYPFTIRRANGMGSEWS